MQRAQPLATRRQYAAYESDGPKTDRPRTWQDFTDRKGGNSWVYGGLSWYRFITINSLNFLKGFHDIYHYLSHNHRRTIWLNIGTSWDFKAYMNTYREIQVAMSLMLISVEG